MTGLILAGTYEARMLCAACVNKSIPAIASLAGETRNPIDLGIETRVGGFGGATGFETYIKQAGITWVVDATHPFATNMTDRAATVCTNLGIPYMVLQRTEWRAETGDKWHKIDAISELPSLIPANVTVFLGTGRKTLMEYGCLSGRRLLCRVIDKPVSKFPLKNGAYLVDRPPFSVEQEVKMLKQHNIDWLVVKNAGGSGGFSKLAAARQLGLPVAMLNRQTPKNVQIKHDVSSAMSWLKSVMK
jgi:precorrin-6A/cobalt-precorrin-6A reductase